LSKQQAVERGWVGAIHHVRFWHLADIDAGAEHIRSGG